MSYWLNLFSMRTWEDFRSGGSSITGFSPKNWTRAKRIQPGDYFLCYLIGAKRWIGALKVLNDRYYDDRIIIFRDAIYPVRFGVEPLAALEPETAVPMEELQGRLSFFPEGGGYKDWSGHVRSSPTRFRDEDGMVIFDTIMERWSNPVRIPIEPKTLAMANRKKSRKAETELGEPGSQVAKNPKDKEITSPKTEDADQSEVAPGAVDPSTDQEATPEGIDEGDAEIHTKEGVSIEKADRSLAELHRWYRSGKLVIDPEWQRSYVWDNRRASKLIESFLMDIPIPVVYLAKTEGGKYEVIDGVQRLTSVFNFFEGQITLSGMEFLDTLNRKQFKDIEHVHQSKLEDSTIRTFELSPKTSKSLLFVIFERLNTGGIALNEMEIRNCIYRGPLNDLIKELAKNAAFRECVDQSNLSKRMYDRNLVLRFLAFYEKTYHKAQSGLKDFLNGFLQDFYRDPSQKKIQEWRVKFEGATKAARTIFGQNGFRLWLTDRRGNGQWAKNVNASIFQCLAVSLADYDTSLLTRCSDAILEEYLDLVTGDPQWVDGVTKSTGDSNRIKYVFETWMARLNALLSSVDGLDSDRVFASRLKREIFLQDQTCMLCGQNIKLLQDSALDHDLHYWRGGQTIPSNARLVHRLCNLKRPK